MRPLPKVPSRRMSTSACGIPKDNYRNREPRRRHHCCCAFYRIVFGTSPHECNNPTHKSPAKEKVKNEDSSRIVFVAPETTCPSMVGSGRRRPQSRFR
jgi:hypothetical protein